MPIGQVIKELSKKNKISALELAELLGLSKQAVYDIFKKESIDSKHLFVFSKIFKVSLEYFFTGKEYPDNNLHLEKTATLPRETDRFLSIIESQQETIKNLSEVVKQKR